MPYSVLCDVFLHFATHDFEAQPPVFTHMHVDVSKAKSVVLGRGVGGLAVHSGVGG